MPHRRPTSHLAAAAAATCGDHQRPLLPLAARGVNSWQRSLACGGNGRCGLSPGGRRWAAGRSSGRRLSGVVVAFHPAKCFRGRRAEHGDAQWPSCGVAPPGRQAWAIPCPPDAAPRVRLAKAPPHSDTGPRPSRNSRQQRNTRPCPGDHNGISERRRGRPQVSYSLNRRAAPAPSCPAAQLGCEPVWPNDDSSHERPGPHGADRRSCPRWRLGRRRG